MEVDDRAGGRVEQDRDRQLPGEGDTDCDEGRAWRIRLLDLLDGYQQVLAALLEGARRAVDEPELVLVNGVARHVAQVDDVVEDDQHPPDSAGEADVAGQRVGRRKIPDRAIAVDIDLRGRSRVDKAIYHAAEIGDTTADGLCPRWDGGQQRQCAGEQQDSDPAVAPHTNCVAGSHGTPSFPIAKQFVGGWDRGSPRCGLDSGGPAVIRAPRSPLDR